MNKVKFFSQSSKKPRYFLLECAVRPLIRLDDCYPDTFERRAAVYSDKRVTVVLVLGMDHGEDD